MTRVSRNDAAGLGTAPPRRSCAASLTTRRLVASGSARTLQTDVVRAMLVLRANALAVGLSGVRVVVTELLCGMLNAGIHPVIPSRGSVGASGDLAPLAHLALVAIGEGEAEVGGSIMSGAAALAGSGLEP